MHEDLAKELYDLLGDYAEPVGLIQTVDAQTLKVSLKPFKRERTKLLVVATESSLSSAEKRLPISERVGMVERIS